MEKLIQEFISKRNWAVIGVSADPSKYGNKVFKDLRKAGYNVFGINAKGGTVDGQPLFDSLHQLKGKVDVGELVVDFVVPPKVTHEMLPTCKELGIRRVWFQPGSENEEAITFCNSNGIAVVYNACAMLKKRIWENSSNITGKL